MDLSTYTTAELEASLAALEAKAALNALTAELYSEPIRLIRARLASRAAACREARDWLDSLEDYADRPDVQVDLHGSVAAYETALAAASAAFFALNMRDTPAERVVAAEAALAGR